MASKSAGTEQGTMVLHILPLGFLGGLHKPLQKCLLVQVGADYFGRTKFAATNVN